MNEYVVSPGARRGKPTRGELGLAALVAGAITLFTCAQSAQSQGSVQASAKSETVHTLYLDKNWTRQAFAARLDKFYPAPTDAQKNAYVDKFFADNKLSGENIPKGFYDNAAKEKLPGADS